MLITSVSYIAQIRKDAYLILDLKHNFLSIGYQELRQEIKIFVKHLVINFLSSTESVINQLYRRWRLLKNKTYR